METRVKKYYTDEFEKNTEKETSRSQRNANLYKHVYGKYENLDNLPVEDNTNEIDMEKLRELVLNSETKKEEKKIKEDLNILEQRKRRIDEQKLYDINKILEKAKYENSKLKEPTTKKTKPQRTILDTLKSTELSLEEINKAKELYREKNNNRSNKVKDETLSMTRELKYKDLGLKEKQQEKEEPTPEIDNLSLDLFEDLKPTGNTIITKPVKHETITKTIKSDIHSGDTSDIDIIKEKPKAISEDFFTNSYEFSKKDFSDPDEDFYDESQSGGILKIILLILSIFIFIGVIIYFIGTYGLGI